MKCRRFSMIATITHLAFLLYLSGVTSADDQDHCVSLNQDFIMTQDHGPVNNVSCIRLRPCNTTRPQFLNFYEGNHSANISKYLVDPTASVKPYHLIKLQPPSFNLTVKCCLAHQDVQSCENAPLRQYQVLQNHSLISKGEANCKNDTISITCWFDLSYFSEGCLVALISDDKQIIKMLTLLRKSNETKSLKRDIPGVANMSISNIAFYGIKADYNCEEEEVLFNISINCTLTPSQQSGLKSTGAPPESGKITALAVIVAVLGLFTLLTVTLIVILVIRIKCHKEGSFDQPEGVQLQDRDDSHVTKELQSEPVLPNLSEEPQLSPVEASAQSNEEKSNSGTTLACESGKNNPKKKPSLKLKIPDPLASLDANMAGQLELSPLVTSSSEPSKKKPFQFLRQKSSSSPPPNSETENSD